MKNLIIGVFLLFNIPLSFSQQSECSVCNEALRKDIFKFTSNLYVYSKYLEEISEHEYDELKRDLSSGMSVPIPELGGIVSGSLDYSDFQKKIHNYNLKIEKENVFYKTIDYKNYRTNPIAYDAWKDCMLNCNGKMGIYLIKSIETEDNITYTIQYKGGAGAPSLYHLKIEFVSEGIHTKKELDLSIQGQASVIFDRTFKSNKSQSSLLVNAYRPAHRSVDYTATDKTIFYKPSGLKVVSLNYSYLIKLFKDEVGARVQNCVMSFPIPPCFGTLEKGASCDNKWLGFYHTISIKPSDGYYFEPIGDYKQMLKLEGPMGGWNWGQRCPQNDKILVNTPQEKVLKLWLHQDVNAHLELRSYKDTLKQETAFANVDVRGVISFYIPNDRLVSKYNVSVALSNGTIINFTNDTVNDFATINNYPDKTLFTLKSQYQVPMSLVNQN